MSLVWLLLAKLRVPGAWLAAALFALHPIQAETVSWISERKNVLSIFFFLVSLYVYLRYAGVIEPGSGRDRHADGGELRLRKAGQDRPGPERQQQGDQEPHGTALPCAGSPGR